MDATIDIVRQEMKAGFKEVNGRLSELRREVTARIEDTRREVVTRIEETRREVLTRIDENQREVSARIDALRRESNARIDALRAEMLDNFKLIDAKIERVRTESMAFTQGVQNRRDDDRKDHDRQFRWLIGLVFAALLGIAGMFAKAAHFY